MNDTSFLKTYLHERHLTVQQFADLAGVNKRTLDPYMCGNRHFRDAKFSLALKVADALKIDPHELLKD